MARLPITTGIAVVIAGAIGSLAVAQNPKPPTPLPPEIQSVDQLPIPDAVTFWVNGQNLTVYVDSTSNPDAQHKLSTLEIKWDGPGPGFVAENCDFENIFDGDFDVCTAEKIAKVKTRGFGPVYDLGNIIPDGYRNTWSPSDAWIADGAFIVCCTLDCMNQDSPFFGPIPEPSSLMLCSIGLLLLRKRR